jgi:hypothetical protein
MSLSPSVAQLVGVPQVQDGLRSYDVSRLPERVGWLSHPGFIAGFGDARTGSIVTRGIHLMVKLMCRQPLAVPDNLSATIRSFAEEFQEQSERERSEERQRMAKATDDGGEGNSVCWGCHSQFEPLAYGFERFDAAGRLLGKVDARGQEIRIDGWLTDDLGAPEGERLRYQGMSEFMLALSQSEVVQACMAEHFLAYATARAATAAEKEWSIALRGGLSGPMTLPALSEAIVMSELFRATQVGSPEEPSQ